MMRKFYVVALAMTLLMLACQKVTDRPMALSDQIATDRKPNGWTPPIPTRFEDYWILVGSQYVRFCDGLGWNCWGSFEGEPYWWWNLPNSLAWPLTDPDDNSGPIVVCQLDADANLKMQILSEWPTFEEVLESAGGNVEAAEIAYESMRRRVNVPSVVVLDPAICAMLFDEYDGQSVHLIPGEYPIEVNEEGLNEVTIDIEIR